VRSKLGFFHCFSCKAGGNAITVSVYKEGDGDEAKYYGTCSETPYKFSLSRYSAGKYLKTAADISANQ